MKGAQLAMSMLISVIVDRLEERIDNDDLTESPISMVRRELDILEAEVTEAKAKFDLLSPEAQAATIQDMADSVLEAVGATPAKPRGDLQ